MITKTQIPYEFLARWTDGKLAGAHVGFITTITENGVVLSTKTGDVMPVDIGSGKGFPLQDILDQTHVDALVAFDAAKADVTAKDAELEAAVAAAAAKDEKIAELEAVVDAAKAAVAARDAKIAGLEADVTARDAKIAAPESVA